MRVERDKLNKIIQYFSDDIEILPNRVTPAMPYFVVKDIKRFAEGDDINLHWELEGDKLKFIVKEKNMPDSYVYIKIKNEPLLKEIQSLFPKVDLPPIIECELTVRYDYARGYNGAHLFEYISPATGKPAYYKWGVTSYVPDKIYKVINKYNPQVITEEGEYRVDFSENRWFDVPYKKTKYIIKVPKEYYENFLKEIIS